MNTKELNQAIEILKTDGRQYAKNKKIPFDDLLVLELTNYTFSKTPGMKKFIEKTYKTDNALGWVLNTHFPSDLYKEKA